jgi:Ca2+-binding EF-hand superfamily protein
MRSIVVALGVVAMVPAAIAGGLPQIQGGVNAVSAAPESRGTRVVLTVSGSNPCRQVSVDYGDGQIITHPIDRLPAKVTHDYARAGTYNIRARGLRLCAGEASTTVRATGAGTAPAAGPVRFPGMDRNNDGVITRQEWRGSAQSFRVHDWNNDGVLSNEEVRAGARRPAEEEDFLGWPDVRDWTDQRFQDLDHNRDKRLTRDEWHADLETFRRADRNRDNALTVDEFLDADFDDDRGDQFAFLDVNRNGRIERSEWHASADAFAWLDRNRDGVLGRDEVVGDDPRQDVFTSLDINRDRVVTSDEWHWTRRSFVDRDRDGDGRLSRAELEAAPPPTGAGTGAAGAVDVVVRATERWTDTGLQVRAGDVIRFQASGSIEMSAPEDIADPRGARNGRRAPEAPLRDAAAGALIGRIGDGAPFLIADRADAIRMTTAGRLYLGINDDYLGDNSGQFRVRVMPGR